MFGSNPAIDWLTLVGIGYDGVGLNALDIERPDARTLVIRPEGGYLPDGVSLPVGTWAQPVSEPEIAVYMAADLPGGGDRAMTIAAIRSLGPAIELVDFPAPPSDVETALSGNIYHRHVILGAPDPARQAPHADEPVVLRKKNKRQQRQNDQ